jgi:hypothetical protein
MESWMAAKSPVKVGADREIARPAEVSAAAAHGRFQIPKFATVMEGGVEL